MYDAREKARRDWQAALQDAYHRGYLQGLRESRDEGLREVLVECVQFLQELLDLPLGDERELRALNLEALWRLVDDLKNLLLERQGR